MRTDRNPVRWASRILTGTGRAGKANVKQRREGRTCPARDCRGEAAEWNDTPEAFKTKQEDGSYVFTFIINNPSGNSVINLNPQAATERIVEQIERELDKNHNKSEKHDDPDDPGSWSYFVKSILPMHAGRDLKALLVIAPQYFADVLHELPLFARTANSCSILRAFGDEDKRRKEIDTLLAVVKKRIRDGFGPSKRNPAITNLEMSMAILDLGGRPNAYQIAKKLKESKQRPISQHTVNKFWQDRGFKSLDEFLDAFNERRRREAIKWQGTSGSAETQGE